MKKSERLWLIVLLLRQHEKLTALKLANHLEVTKRTIYRDIDALCQMGIPIISEEGASGGYSILSDYFLSCIHLYEKEIILLELLLKMSSQFQLSDFEEEAKSLNLKLSSICEKNNNQKSAFSKISLSVSNIVPISQAKGVFETILKALDNNNKINISYYNPLSDTITERKICPLHFFFNEGCWYLDSYCEIRREMRTFRLDRITKIKCLEDKITTSQLEIFKKLSYLENIIVSLEINYNLFNKIKDDLAMQKIINSKLNNNALIIDIETRNISYFVNLALRNAEEVTILSPKYIIDSILQISQNIFKKYNFPK